MRHARIALAFAALLAFDGLAQAGAPIFGPPGGVHFGYSGRRIGVSVSIGGFGYYSPYGYSPYFGPTGYAVFAPPTSTTVIMPVRVIQPVFQLPPAEPAPNLVRDEDFPDKIVIRPRQQQQLVRREDVPPPDDPPLRPLPGQAAGGFRPIPDEERARVQPEMAPLPLIPDQPEKEPLAESARQLALGRQFFALKEYARAERRFQEAARVAPKEAIPLFHLAQARFAQGKYREASVAIHAGLRLTPDWPALPVKVRELYQDVPAEFDSHLKRLEEALVKNPADPTLLFLYAHQLWFDGRQAEARPLFRRAARFVTAPFLIDLFLLGQPGPVARK